MQGKVISLFITHDNPDKTRQSVEQIEADMNGILTDKFYAKDIQRAILITSQDSYEISQNNGIKLNEGALGENILIDINPYHLVAGDKIRISNLELEITQNCTLCQGLSAIDSKLPKLLKNDRGIFAKVISKSANITIGDRVEILNH